MIYLIVLFLAFLAGFAVRRGSICLVRATHEIVERKPAKTMFFVIEAMTVALSITIPAMIFFPEYISLAKSHDLSVYLFLGASLYGIGAAANDACALGTLNQLMNGKVEYVATILGLAFGFMVFLNLDLMHAIHDLENTNNASLNIFLFIPLMLLVWAIVVLQIMSFVRESKKNKLNKFKRYLTSPVARDFIGVSIFGLCSGALFLLLGRSWDYTKLIMEVEVHLYAGSLPDMTILPVMMATIALITGMAIATSLSKSFKLRSSTFKAFAVKFFAGAVMGAAVGLIPGGNDTIILHGVPGLALHAPIALMVMMMTIAIIVYIKKLK